MKHEREYQLENLGEFDYIYFDSENNMIDFLDSKLEINLYLNGSNNYYDQIFSNLELVKNDQKNTKILKIQRICENVRVVVKSYEEDVLNILRVSKFTMPKRLK